MNLLWVAAIALFVLVEKIIPRGVGRRPRCRHRDDRAGALLLVRG